MFAWYAVKLTKFSCYDHFNFYCVLCLLAKLSFQQFCGLEFVLCWRNKLCTSRLFRLNTEEKSLWCQPFWNACVDASVRSKQIKLQVEFFDLNKYHTLEAQMFYSKQFYHCVIHKVGVGGVYGNSVFSHRWLGKVTRRVVLWTIGVWIVVNKWKRTWDHWLRWDRAVRLVRQFAGLLHRKLVSVTNAYARCPVWGDTALSVKHTEEPIGEIK